jgi:hypothetical protein
MDALERDYNSVLLADHEPPCLSLYQPTHRSHPEKQQDPNWSFRCGKNMPGARPRRF